MWRLTPYHYWLVPLQKAKAGCWLLDPHASPLICSAAAYISTAPGARSAIQSDEILINVVHKAYLSHKEAISISDVESALQLLSIRSAPPLAKNFISKEDYQLQQERYDFIGLTERSFVPHSIFLGSSRHVLLPGLQLKGVGRNDLANQFNYYHSWGGLPFRDVLKSIVSDQVVRRRSKLGCLSVVGALIYQEPLIGELPLCILLRENDSYRLSQIAEHMTSKADRLVLQDHLQTRFQSRDPEKILESILQHYYDAFLSGITHKSFNRENILIDGRFIDTESIDFTQDGITPATNLTLAFPDQTGPALGLQLSNYIREGERTHIVQSWFHNIKYAVALTASALEIVFERTRGSLARDGVARYLMKVSPHLAPWLMLSGFKNAPEHLEGQFDAPRESFEWTREMASFFGPMRAVAEYKYENGAREITFTFDPDQVPDHSYTLQHVNRIEALVWPKAQSVEDAQAMWRLIETYCRKL